MTCVLQADDVASPGESQPGHVVEVLVAKQQEERKPKGLRKRDEQSEQFMCTCVWARERERERERGLEIRAASVVIIRCCRNSRHASLSPLLPSSSLFAVWLTDSKTCLSLSSFPFTVSLIIPPHPLRCTSSSVCHTKLHSLWRNCKCSVPIYKTWLNMCFSLTRFYSKVTESQVTARMWGDTFVISDTVLSCLTFYIFLFILIRISY